MFENRNCSVHWVFVALTSSEKHIMINTLVRIQRLKFQVIFRIEFNKHFVQVTYSLASARRSSWRKKHANRKTKPDFTLVSYLNEN